MRRGGSDEQALVVDTHWNDRPRSYFVCVVLVACATGAAYGKTALRLGTEYELLLTQKLILQPRVEINLYGKSDPARDIGSGLSDALAGLRLRYEVRREFAPYVGLEWAGKFGETANFAREAGAKTSETRWVAGVRFWF
jgi:copper resistance protein B